MRANHTRPTLAALAVALSSACVTVNSTLLPGAEVREPLEPSQVNVLISPPDTMPTDCQRVAVLTAAGDANATDRQEMIEQLREEAGRIGANTVFLSEIDEPGGSGQADRHAQALALFCEPPQPDNGGDRRAGAALAFVTGTRPVAQGRRSGRHSSEPDWGLERGVGWVATFDAILQGEIE